MEVAAAVDADRAGEKPGEPGGGFETGKDLGFDGGACTLDLAFRDGMSVEGVLDRIALGADQVRIRITKATTGVD